MGHNEPWQVFAKNGVAIDDYSAPKDEFHSNQSLIMGASHVWMWRHSGDGIEVLLQKRSLSKKTWPGYHDISAAGHIDVGETPIESAVREAGEELGILIDTEELFYIFSLRTPLVANEIDHVYLYEMSEDFDPVFNDGEVESTEWLTLDTLRSRLQDPGKHKIVNQGQGYFSLLLGHLDRL